ncbi:MAG: hypothetical protein IPI67_38715 [Myxococcales bacterium]|nr:hypothetical protein [Myxococcales bacterium]
MKSVCRARARDKGAPDFVLSILPDPSELIPPAVRRLAGCSCDGSDSAPVCVIECRSGAGATGPVANGSGGGGDDGFGDKNTAPAAAFGGKATKPAGFKQQTKGGATTSEAHATCAGQCVMPGCSAISPKTTALMSCLAKRQLVTTPGQVGDSAERDLNRRSRFGAALAPRSRLPRISAQATHGSHEGANG